MLIAPTEGIKNNATAVKGEQVHSTQTSAPIGLKQWDNFAVQRLPFYDNIWAPNPQELQVLSFKYIRREEQVF